MINKIIKLVKTQLTEEQLEEFWLRVSKNDNCLKKYFNLSFENTTLTNYPYLAKGLITGKIVIFVNHNKGIIIKNINGFISGIFINDNEDLHIKI